MRTLSGVIMLTVLAMQILGLAFTSASPNSSNLTNFPLKCDDICNSTYCFYPLYEEMLPDPEHKDCEAALYALDGVLLDHSSLSENPTNLRTKYCTDELLLKITCNMQSYRYQALYTAFNMSIRNGLSATSPGE
ncbi:hypothetical protein AMELA_G00176590 [Ameiurus melas]|uniref:Uncharacterized protein n=1 Tax=Ameiurus melas TaxID=219545 RepID=A0A7J6AD93_AMEME|nr:hypothetical protein AMELA_G00176590 [Ameiurus melas]